jgi:hypothetical protein
MPLVCGQRDEWHIRHHQLMEFIVDLELFDENIQPEPAKPSRVYGDEINLVFQCHKMQ